MLGRPSQAPQHWELCDTEEIIREQIVELAPDIVLFQELPGLVPYIETHSMVRSNPQSHSGHLAFLISHQHSESSVSHKTLEGFALLVTFEDIGLTVANVHLAPGKANNSLRVSQIASVIESSPTEKIAIIGDTNTRKAEISQFQNKYY